MKKKLLAILLTVCMVLSMAPAALAANSVFTDVKADDWYADEIKWVYDEGLMDGVGGDSFAPETTTTRAMLVTILWRLEGEPAPARTNPFTDVPAGEWYTEAVVWAAENKIVEGYGANLFGPTDELTREQMVTILYRYAQYKEYDVKTEGDLSAYTDADKVADWAQAAMLWAIENGLINGVTDTTLAPQGDAIRGQLAAILYRLNENVIEPAEKEEEPEPSPKPSPEPPTHICVVVSTVVTAPTCEERGYTTYTTCCGYSYKGNYVDTVDHVAGEKCPHCGVTEVETAEQLAAALSADDEKIDVVLLKDIEVPVADLSQWGQTPGSGEYKLGGDSTTAIIIDLNEHKLTLTTGYMTAIGAKNDDATITIKNGSMNGTGNSQTTWNIYDLIFANCNYVFEGVTFEKEVALCNTGKTVTMNDVTINGTGDYYALWIQGEGQTVNIDGLTVNTPGRGIKIDEQYSNENVAKVTLAVSDAKFTTAKKAAIMVKSADGADIDLSNVDISGVVADSENHVWVDEDSAAYQQLVTVTGGNKILEGAVAKIGDMYYSTLQEAVDAAENGDTITILAAGDYSLPEFAGMELTFKGVDKENTSITDYVNKASQGMMGSTVNFENLTVNGRTAYQDNYWGLYHTNALSYKNCIVNGNRFLFAPTVSFENCVFDAGDTEHCVWTYGAQNITFTKCAFAYGDRGINCYSDDGVPGGKQTVTFTDCTFSTESAASEGAVEINSCFFSVGIEVNMTNCTAPAYGDMVYVSQWDSSKGTKTTIIIDGKQWVSSQEALAAAINRGATTIYLTDGNYYVPACQGKTITIKGGTGAVVDASDNSYGYQTLSGANITFDGVTMEGRKQKAREGKWNGGFAPYGYKLVNGYLEIAEDEAEVIRLIFDKYTSTTMGAPGIAEYLNEHGYEKKKRQNNTLDMFSVNFIKKVLDNPVYCGKLAYGRRKTEKIPGTRNQYHVVTQEEYPVYDGVHEAIVSEEVWLTAQKKRKANSHKWEKIYHPERENLLSGILKCPVCGAGMYGNVNRKRKKDGTLYKDYYYYTCKHRRPINGHRCGYPKQWKQEKVDSAVEELLRSMVNNPKFEQQIRAKIGAKIDTGELEAEVGELKKTLRQLNGAKNKLGTQMDALDVTDKFYDRKYQDMEDRLYKLYEDIDRVESQIEEVEIRIKNVRQQKISGDNIYQFLLCFDKLYNMFSDSEKKEFLNSFVESVEVFEEEQDDGRFLKRIKFRFPVFFNGEEVEELSLDNFSTLECVVELRK